jgi:hypothetical protein
MMLFAQVIKEKDEKRIERKACSCILACPRADAAAAAADIAAKNKNDHFPLLFRPVRLSFTITRRRGCRRDLYPATDFTTGIAIG